MRGAIHRILLFSCGAILLGLSAGGLALGARAALAQGLYWQVRMGPVKDYEPADLRYQATLWRCEDAHAWYPHNYYFCIRMGELAFYERCDRMGREKPARLETARRWCDAGLALNPYNSQLRRLKTHLLERESAAAARDYWRRHVEWQFWEPYNHAVLSELQAKAGDYEDALESLQWTRGSAYYEEAARKVAEAMGREARTVRSGMSLPGGR